MTARWAGGMVAVSADGGKTFGAPQSAVAGVFDSPAGRADLFKAVPAASPSVAGKPVAWPPTSAA